MHDQTLQHIPFIIRRRELIMNDIKNRRELIFNRTRQLLTQSLFINDNISQCQVSEQQAIMQMISSKQPIILQQYVQQHKYKQSQQRQKRQATKHSNNHNNHINNKPKQQYYKNFQFPQWLTQIPQNINNYYFSLRPIGERVLVHLLRRKMLIISMYGVVLDTVVVNKSQYANCIFEGYYVKEGEIINSDNVSSTGGNTNNNTNSNNFFNNNFNTNTQNNNNTFTTNTNPLQRKPPKQQQRLLLISDLLVWKQNPMTCSQFEFRMMWLLINFNQQIINTIMPNKILHNKSHNNNKNNSNSCQTQFDVQLMMYSRVNEQNIKLQWQQRQYKYKYKVDAILFYQKDQYYIHGLNPAVLLWKQPLTINATNLQNNNTVDLQNYNSTNTNTTNNYSNRHNTNFINTPIRSQQQSPQSSSSAIFPQPYKQQQQQICENQLNSLTISQPKQNNHNHLLSFYGEFVTDSLTLFTLDEVPIKKFNQQQQTNKVFINQVKQKYGQKCIVRFSFVELQQNNQYETMIEDNHILGIVDNRSIEHNMPYKLTYFKIISVHDINYRIPDCLSKLLWKYNLQKGVKIIDYEKLIKQIHQAGRQSNMEHEQN